MTELDSTAYVFAAQRRKEIIKDPNPNSFWIDMPFLIQIAKAKEENPNCGAKQILDELHASYSERSVKKNSQFVLLRC